MLSNVITDTNEYTIQMLSTLRVEHITKSNVI